MASVLFFNGEALDDFRGSSSNTRNIFKAPDQNATTYQSSFKADNASIRKTNYYPYQSQGAGTGNPTAIFNGKKSSMRKYSELQRTNNDRKSRANLKRMPAPTNDDRLAPSQTSMRSRSQSMAHRKVSQPLHPTGPEAADPEIRKVKQVASTGNLDKVDGENLPTVDYDNDNIDILNTAGSRTRQLRSRLYNETDPYYDQIIDAEENFDRQSIEEEPGNFLGDNPQSLQSDLREQVTGLNLYQSSNQATYSMDEVQEIWRVALPIEEIYINDKLSRLKSLLRLNGIIRNTFKAYKVRVINNAIIFPRYVSPQESQYDGLDFIPSGLKIIRLPEFNPNSSLKVEMHPMRGAYSGMFGYNLVSSVYKEIVLVSSESDALAIYQATNEHVPALVLPDNAGPLSDDAVPHLMQFSRIVIWLPVEHYLAARQFSRKLTSSNCHIITPKISNRSPSEMLDIGNVDVACEKISNIIGIAEAAFPRDIETFQMLRESVKSFILSAEYVGKIATWQRFPILNQIFKGFRCGELTILTGSTGCGKSTFLSEYSLDLCEQNVSTLWCNLESSNSRLVSVMVQQYAKKSFGITDSEFDFWYNKLMSLPMYFTQFDSSTTQSTIETIDNLIVTHDVQHVIVDNLQWMAFLTSDKAGNEMGSITSRFSDNRVDALCTYFQKLTRNKHIHVTLVIHPEIENEETGISFTSLHGNELKAFQQADNVIVMQRKLSRLKDNVREKYLQVWKNRFVGEVVFSDRLLMLFDSRTKCHRIFNKKMSRSE